jgi:hypothetical protein
MAALIAAAVVNLVTGTAYSSLDVSIEPPVTYAAVGDVVVITAHVDGQDSVGWFYVRIHTDAAVLTYLSCGQGITSGCPRQSQCMECGPTGEPGMVSACCACLGTGTCVAPGDLVIVKYRAAAIGISQVHFDLASASDCQRNMINLGGVADGEVIVGTASVGDGDQIWESTVSSCSCYPDPFVGGITLQYYIENLRVPPATSSGDIEIKIYDCHGRLVRGLAAGLAAGEHRVTWDGSDQRGVPVSPGFYFCRFPVAGGVKTFKIVKAN